MGVISLKIVRFSIRNYRWKALEVYNPEIYMPANCLWPKFAKFSCRKHLMFYSILKLNSSLFYCDYVLVHLQWKRLSIDAPPATHVVKFFSPKVLLSWWIDTHFVISSNGSVMRVLKGKQRHTQTGPILLPLPLTWEVMVTKFILCCVVSLRVQSQKYVPSGAYSL